MNITDVKNLEDFAFFRLVNDFTFTDMNDVSLAFYWMWKAGMADIARVNYPDYSDFFTIAFCTNINVRYDNLMFVSEEDIYPTFWSNNDPKALELKSWYECNRADVND